MEPLSATATKNYLEGPTVAIEEDYGGLGAHFLDTLLENSNKIHQLDTITGLTETNDSVRSRAIQIAHELRHFGIVENDIILICSRGHADQTIVVLACLLIGAIVAPIDSELHHKESVELVNQLKPKMCFCDPRTLKQIERITSETGVTFELVHFGPKHPYALGFHKLLMTRQYPEQFKPVNIEEPRKRVAFILPTQGTTGPPKLVCLSHHFIYCQITILLEMMDAPKKIISFYPLSYVLQVILMCLCFKAPILRVLTGVFTERTACKTIHDLQIDHAFLNTDLALQLSKDVAVKDFNLSSLKSIFVGGLVATSSDIRRLVCRFPKVRFTQLYCTTEVGIAIAPPPEHYDDFVERIGTIGKAVQNCKLRVVNIDTGKDVGKERSGELLVGSDCMMLGYFKNMSVTKSFIQEGFFKTGDLVKYDGNGWLYIEGKTSDLIKIQGLRESPLGLEHVIKKHPFVEDSVVISDDTEVVACVIIKAQAKLDEKKLLLFVSEKLPAENCPTRVVFMTDFPTTPFKKVRREILKQEIFKPRIERSATGV